VARANLVGHDIRGLSVIVRINASESPCFDGGLAALAKVNFTVVILPKTNTPGDVAAGNGGTKPATPSADDPEAAPAGFRRAGH
jgi:citrate lyase beta subunit